MFYRSMAVSLSLLSIVQAIIRIYDYCTGWLYRILYRPEKVLEERMKQRAVQVKPIQPGDNEVTYKPLPMETSKLVKEFELAQCSTMAEVWRWAVDRYKTNNLLGTRDVVGEEDEVQNNGQIFRKLILGDYRWMTYEDADQLADNVGRGLRVLGLTPNKPICIFADTRAEWLVTAQACFRHSLPVVTLYTNLGDSAIEHGLNETEAQLLYLCNEYELLPKFKNILKETPNIKQIVYFDNPIKRTDTAGFRPDVRIVNFWEVVTMGKKSTNNNIIDVDVEPVLPTPDSPCIIMYTSGSTGTPKGVVVTHRNIVSCVSSYLTHLNTMDFTDEDRYIGYLPLAHILELIAENMMVVFGVAIGYSSPNTLTDKSTMIKKGAKGDTTVLKPTFMACVPLILDRIYKGIHENVRKKGDFTEKLFDFCVRYKMAAAERGEITPVMDRLIFRAVRNLIGGRVRVILTGGAPLSPESHDYIRTCMGCPVLQGYGLTETCACATLMPLGDHSTGRVGPPVTGVNIRLENWEEGNYRVTDKPRPRGEILIGGGSITTGYYKNPEKTAEDYFTDNSGRRWFKSGDIGQMEPDGTLKIIDRKKDLVKLQFGEYVSLGKVESVLKTSSIVENVCVYGDSKRSYVVALVCPDRSALTRLAGKLGKSGAVEDLVNDRDVVGAVLRELMNQGKLMKLQKFEIPGAVYLCLEQWTPDSGLVTAAFKLKRKPLQEFYQGQIDRMYGA
ncbi:long-chain-fatty-acid--CoA ligase 4 [Eurytemora carolleeae]|uniref:long-chain-fatty-acid--CoA ligase 4 n=1 Tax=Eurytemora carolleeae TaxID=1294199 RepID=UPI000C75C0AD|nr:long-chain-fatty-acid--CoA ligase 4 [Eurytemora carolleeae]|eukprot:XP_023342990.1 long-chain-fatty-acid--CoA ligase 4-like [Eurytemora affinis]